MQVKANSDSPLYLVVVNNEFLFQNLDGVEIIRLLLLCQHDFTKVTLPENCQKVEVVQANLSLAGRLTNRWGVVVG
jgi:hypothetical protein